MQPVDERFYGRRHGKRIKGTRLYLMENLLPNGIIRIMRPIDTLLPKIQIIEKQNEKININNLFDFTPREVWLEVGFGGGEHLAYQAKQHPDIGFIGAEPFLNGVASLLSHLTGTWGKAANESLLIEQDRTDNVRVFADDIRKLFPVFDDGVFQRHV